MTQTQLTWQAALEALTESEVLARARTLEGALSWMTARQDAPDHVHLEALCQGTRLQPYVLWLDLVRAPEAHLKGACACPVGATGRCKHVAALGLAWAHTPQAFAPPFAGVSALSVAQKEQALELLFRMHPHTRQVLNLIDDAATATASEVVASALATTSDAVASLSQRVQRLWPLWEYVRDSFITHHTPRLIDTLRAIVEQLVDLAHGETCPHVDVLLEDIVAHVHTWLSIQPLTPDLTRELWGVLIILGLSDGHLPDASAQARDALMSALSAPQHAQAVLFVRQRLSELGMNDHDLLLALEDPTDASYTRRAMNLGLWRAATQRALAREDHATARQVMERMERDADLLDAAQLCLAHDRDHWALDAVERRFAQSEDPELSQWLEAYYARHEQWVAALSAAQSRFYRGATLECVGALRRYARALEQWPVIRTQVIHGLRQQGALDVLLHLQLQEGALEGAWETVGRGQREGVANQEAWIEACAQLACTLHASWPQRALVLYHQVAAAMESQGGFTQQRILQMRAQAQQLKNALASVKGPLS